VGQEIDNGDFSQAEHAEFQRRLRDETKTLKGWFDERRFEYNEGFDVGLELEAWLVDNDHMPAPRNEDFLARVGDPDIVEELSKFNFEINTPPRPLDRHMVSATQSDLETAWGKSVAAAQPLGLTPVMIGMLPTVRDDMLQTDWMSDSNRYHALNREIFRKRRERPLHIHIEGRDTLDYTCDHIMLEAACTSLQAHLKINQEDAVRFYNAGVLAAAPLVAATANSPFLYGKNLWAETRIPAFEQATATEGFRDSEGRRVLRVTLGTGYLRRSFLELFIENLGYPPLLPALKEDTTKLPHLRLQNGTTWRWVRPILGFDKNKNPHLRIEHRVIPSGPTVVDVTANLALCHGLMLALGKADTPPEDDTPFEAARANFYACARDGLKAAITWRGRKGDVQSLLVNELVPAARAALAREGVAEVDLKTVFDDTLTPRLRTGLTGAAWQRSFVNCHGPCHQGLTERYVANQQSGRPVHEWTV